MKKVSYAAIDIDSSTVWLLIKSVNEEGPPEGLSSKAQLIRIPLRLGEDIFTTGEVLERKAGKPIRLMETYKQLMKIFEVSDYRACATPTMRDTRNGKTTTHRIEKKTGIRVEITDGQEEAYIVYNSHIEQLFASGRNYLYVDVSGGSTEINLICDAELKNSRFYNIDTARMLSGVVKSKGEEQARSDLQALAAEYSSIQIIGSGGNINKLFRLTDEKDKKQSFFPVKSLQKIRETLKPLSKERRIKQFRLKPDRVDIIVPAAEIFLEVAKQVNATGITVPAIGLPDGIIDSLYTKSMRTENDERWAGTHHRGYRVHREKIIEMDHPYLAYLCISNNLW